MTDVAAGGGRDEEHLARRPVEPGHAGEQHVAQRVREGRAGLARDPRGENLLGEVRVALRPRVDPLGERRVSVRAHDPGDLERGVLGGQRGQLEAFEARAASEVGEQPAQRRRGRLVRAQGGEDEQPLLAQVAPEEAQQVLSRVVGPVDVLDDERRRRRLGQAAERAQQQLEQARRRLRRRGRAGAAAVAQLTEQAVERDARLGAAASQRGDDRRVGQLAGL